MNKSESGALCAMNHRCIGRRMNGNAKVLNEVLSTVVFRGFVRLKMLTVAATVTKG